MIFATDISADALVVARENAKMNQVENQIELLQGDLFEPLKNKNLEEKIECVVSNPPYVSPEEFSQLPKEVKEYEPILALKTDQEGTLFHRGIIENSLDFLSKGGILVLEIGLGQAEKVVGIFREYPHFKDIEIKKDLGGIDRVAVAGKV